MVNEFWKYWKRRWPNASSDENKLRNSANYQETRAAFLAGFEAAQHHMQRTSACCGGQCVSGIREGEPDLCSVCGGTFR